MEQKQIKKAKNLIRNLKKFHRWNDMLNLSTQKAAEISEAFVEDSILILYNAKIYKTGSQDHPDFMIVPKEQEKFIKEFNKEVTKKYEKTTKKPKFTLHVLKAWEKSKYNKEKIRMVRVEIKTGKKTTYILNDTLPPPTKELDEIYILFSKKDEKIIVTTSFTMAEAQKTNPPISERYRKSQGIVKEFGEKLKRIWEGIGISTAARPTYGMNHDYAHHEATPEEIANIFQEGGF